MSTVSGSYVELFCFGSEETAVNEVIMRLHTYDASDSHSAR